MPHLIIEYSSNLDERVDLYKAARDIHAAAIETGVFPIGGCRSRLARRDRYVIGDGDPMNAFIHVQARIGAGRTPEVRAKAAEHIFAALRRTAAPAEPVMAIGLSFEFVEIDPVGALKYNTIHDAVERRATVRASART